jgi:predicted transcriptional regulator
MVYAKPYSPGDGTVAIQFRVPTDLNEELDTLTNGDKQKREAFLVCALAQALYESKRWA